MWGGGDRIWQPEEKEIFLVTEWKLASLVVQTVKNLSAMWETWFWSLGWEDSPGGGHGNQLRYPCLENPDRQRSLVGYSPWGHKESDMRGTKRLKTEHSKKLRS